MKSDLKLTAAALAEKAAQAAEAAALAQAAALEAGAEFDAEAEARRQTFMKAWLAEFDDAAANAAQIAARAAFEEAAQADPLMKAWLTVLRLHYRRDADGQTAQNFASQVGVPAPRYDAAHDLPRVAEALQLAVRHLASRLEAERVAEVREALEAAANGEGDV